MKFEKVSTDKLKVTLKTEDMLSWNVTYDNLTDDNPNSNEMFWDLIHMAEKETGMIFENCKLTVEAIQKDDFTYVIFITKSSLSYNKKYVNKGALKKYRYKGTKAPIENTDKIYMFDEFEDIITFVSNHPHYSITLSNMTHLYKYRERYYLMILYNEDMLDIIKDFNNCICEYCLRVNNSISGAILQEHGKLLIKNNALEIIFKNFV